jgi:hypothetical protein
VRAASGYRPTTIHAKTFVVDGEWSAVGTMNFDNRSLAYNDEVALVVLDDTVGGAMESLFHEDLGFADEIRLEGFQRRPRTQRFLERADCPGELAVTVIREKSNGMVCGKLVLGVDLHRLYRDAPVRSWRARWSWWR